MITAAVYTSFVLMLAFLFMERKHIKNLLREHIDSRSLLALVIILLFFLSFSILFVSPTEQLYFDENIYQGIALNILHHGNALWCQFGTGFLQNCYVNALYHDPVGWSAFIALAFLVFGIGTNTAYNLELAVGTLAIVFFFMLASVLVRRKSYAIVSTLAFSLMPQLFIWSRTQADLDLPFMMLAILTFFLFVVFTKRKSIGSLGAFTFALALTTYMRIEAMLLVIVFAVLLLTFEEKEIIPTLKERVRQLIFALQNNTALLILLLVFILAILPEVYYVAGEAQNPSYGQGTGVAVLSLSNFQMNIGTNLLFIFGQKNGISYYPEAFHYTIMPLAILGGVLLGLNKKLRNRFGILLLLLLWFFAYFMFYTAFYAGSAGYGVDSRFMLQLLPAVCLLAGFAIIGISDAAQSLVARLRKGNVFGTLAFGSTIALSCTVLLVFPFWLLVPIAAISPSAMPQQSVILNAMNFFYSNYNAVPQNCLVFSHTPDIWAEVNRSSAQISYLSGANSTNKQTISGYKCLVVDYGYWCVVPPYHDTLCKYITGHYQLKPLAVSQPLPNGNSAGFYQILNYTYS